MAYVQVLAITCGLSDGADLAWWQPWRTAATQRPWLPWAIAVQVCPLLTLPAPLNSNDNMQYAPVGIQYCSCSQKHLQSLSHWCLPACLWSALLTKQLQLLQL